MLLNREMYDRNKIRITAWCV